MAMQDDPGFLGRGWRFPVEFDGNTGSARLVQAVDDINESLRILFETRPGERVMHPNYGCRIHDLVFEPMNTTTARAIENAISRAILYFEPRIILRKVKVRFEDWAQGRMKVHLEYEIEQTNSRHNIVFPFYADEGTLVTSVPVAE
ncbi:GPW/gp25 family protein [Roseovarius aestuarii]|uniref:Gene 25-like lysozyme n=1 Tax=Roseovarius aestuarii TaxID=475083 RepID=A0A1X7BMA3_9RHOB|nr:GPW/gp25 family protein [Roseovarius aestuarii]SMC10660.1 Gene 25-like lysozyme [Roseovarius aestuarii]